LPLVLACPSRSSVLFSPPTRPNIVVLVADDLGYGETETPSVMRVPTPSIDSIAAGGVRFTNGYVTAAYCSASRAGLLTGRYQTRFGYEFNPIGARNEDPLVGLPLGERTMADRLREAGYATALVGKWHLGGTAVYHPQRRGFDEFFGFMHEGHYFVPPPYRNAHTFLRRRVLPPGSSDRWVSADGRLILSSHMGHNEPAYDTNNPILRSSQPVNETEYLTDAFTRESVDFISRHKERPFFLYVAYNAVHSPLQADDERWQRFAHVTDPHRRIFAAMLAALDDSVGTILEELQTQGVRNKTLVVFLSDNGGPTRELTSSNLPLRAGKGSMYEGGIRVPFMMQWPTTIPAGMVVDHPVISLDISATATAAAGLETAAGSDGVNLLPWLTQNVNGAPHDVLFWRTGSKAALRMGDWKLVRDSRRTAAWELYNLSDDIGETRDLAASEPDRRDELLRRWQKLNSEMVEPAW
jgi:arylsulfatase A-like enzyme